MRCMGVHFKISVKKALIITLWTAIWFANQVAVERYIKFTGPWEAPTNSLYYGLVLTPPAAIVGLIRGHAWTGILCGLSSTCALFLSGWVVAEYFM
jgi:hypothetical protein